MEETDEHISRLSLRCSLKGEQYYRVGGSLKLINPETYLLINQGQRYQTSFKGGENQDILIIAFKPGFAEDILKTVLGTESRLLDNPFENTYNSLHFFERSYPNDAELYKHISTISRLIKTPDLQFKKEIIEYLLTAAMERLLQLHMSLSTEIDSMKSVRRSTRIELYRRLHIARDFIEASSSADLKLGNIADAACLSLHHFKREFKNLFGISPHRYLLLCRLKRASLLLKNSDENLDEICSETGFIDTSAFIRLFRQTTGLTPGNFRKNSN